MEPYLNYWPSICQCTRPLLTPMKKRSKKARSLIWKHELIQPKWMLLRQWVRKYWRDWRVGRSGDLKVCFVFGSVVVQLYIYVLVSFGFTAYLEGQFSCFGLFCSQYWNIRAVSLQKSKHKKTKFLHFSSENVILTQNNGQEITSGSQSKFSCVTRQRKLVSDKVRKDLSSQRLENHALHPRLNIPRSVPPGGANVAIIFCYRREHIR